MKKFILTLLMLPCMLAIWTPAHAEGGSCPNGYYPVNSPGVSGCAPIPGYGRQQQSQAPNAPPPPKWESRWGAIATDEPHGIFGSVTGMQSRHAAESAAMSDCAAKGGQDCKLETWYSNGCAALIVGDHVYNVTAESTVERATELGMRICSAGGVTGCHVYFSACSPPVVAK